MELEERVEKLEKEISEIEKFLSSKDDEFIGKTKSFNEYSEKRRPYTSKIARLDRQRRLIMPAVAQGKVENSDDIMSIEHFIVNCKCGGFIDYDGFGRYVKDGIEYNVEIIPSDVKHNSIRKDFNSIVWYNR